MRPHRLGDSGYYNTNEIRISAFRNTTHMGHTVYDNVDSSSKRSIHIDVIAFERIASVQQIIQIGKIIFVTKKRNINGKNTYFIVRKIQIFFDISSKLFIDKWMNMIILIYIKIATVTKVVRFS